MFVSKAQSGFFHWAKAHPAEAAKRGLKPAVVDEFIQAQRGHSTKALPQHVERKADGGRVGYPRTFRW